MCYETRPCPCVNGLPPDPFRAVAEVLLVTVGVAVAVAGLMAVYAGFKS